VFERKFLYAFVGLFQVLKAFCQFAHVVSQFAHFIEFAEKLDVDQVLFLDFVPLRQIFYYFVEQYVALVEMFFLLLNLFCQKGLVDCTQIN
jgi:hypothetical protein